jgi:predicted esterase
VAKHTSRLVGLVLTAFLAAGCTSTNDAEPPFDVTSTVVSHETTQEISVWAPDVDGPWPVVYALHGTGGSREDLAETASALAREGVVVFAADYRSADPQYWERDAECGYRYMLSVAEDHGGDLDEPVTSVGYSLGATLVLEGGLSEATYGPGGTYDECFTGAPRADVTVPIAGCHYEYEGRTFEFDADASRWTNQDTRMILVAGTDDTICEARQSRDAAEALQSAGHDVDLVEIPGANHFRLIFHDLVEGEWQTLPDEPAGMRVVETILDAIAAAEQ